LYDDTLDREHRFTQTGLDVATELANFDEQREEEEGLPVDDMSRFVREVNTWESYRALMLQFLRGELSASYSHWGPLTEDWSAAPHSLIALNEVGRWISFDGQPPQRCEISESVEVRTGDVTTHLPLLEIQRPYIDAFVPTEQIAGLMKFCARYDLNIMVNACSVNDAAMTKGSDWLTVERVLRPEERERLRSTDSDPSVVREIVRSGVDGERPFRTRFYTQVHIEDDMLNYSSEMPPKLRNNVDEIGKYMKVRIWAHMSSLRLTDLLYEQFVRKIVPHQQRA